MTWSDIVDFFVTLGGLAGIAAIIVALSQALKWRSEAARLQDELRNTAKTSDISNLRAIIDELQEENKRLYERIAELRTSIDQRDDRIADLEDEITELRAYMEKQGLKPPPRKPRK